MNQPGRADLQWVTQGIANTHVHFLSQQSPLWKSSTGLFSFFSASHLVLLFLSLPLSLCPSILQSYKKAIDEVSYTPLSFIPVFLCLDLQSPSFFPPWHGGIPQEDHISLFQLYNDLGAMEMAVHVCFYTHTWESVCGRVLVRVCVCVCVGMHAFDVCVCARVCSLNCQAPEQSLKLFSCFSIVTVTGQEDLVSPPCMTVSPHPPTPVCMIWFDPLAVLNGGREGRPVGMGVIGRGGVWYMITFLCHKMNILVGLSRKSFPR